MISEVKRFFKGGPEVSVAKRTIADLGHRKYISHHQKMCLGEARNITRRQLLKNIAVIGTVGLGIATLASAGSAAVGEINAAQGKKTPGNAK